MDPSLGGGGDDVTYSLKSFKQCGPLEFRSVEGCVSDSGKPKRRKLKVACERCRKTKVGCDGLEPCANCVAKGVQCVYDKERLRKTQAKANSNKSADKGGFSTDFKPETVQPKPATTHTDQYLEIFFEYINKTRGRLVDYDDFMMIRATPQGAFMEACMNAMSARACGHHAVETEHLKKARETAQTLFASLCPHTTIGFGLLSMYYYGANYELATYFADLACSLCKHIADETTRNKVERACLVVSKLEAPKPFRTAAYLANQFHHVFTTEPAFQNKDERSIFHMTFSIVQAQLVMRFPTVFYFFWSCKQHLCSLNTIKLDEKDVQTMLLVLDNSEGLLGKDSDSFGPLSVLTRAEVAGLRSMLWNAQNNKPDTLYWARMVVEYATSVGPNLVLATASIVSALLVSALVHLDYGEFHFLLRAAGLLEILAACYPNAQSALKFVNRSTKVKVGKSIAELNIIWSDNNDLFLQGPNPDGTGLQLVDFKTPQPTGSPALVENELFSHNSNSQDSELPFQLPQAQPQFDVGLMHL